MNRQPVAGMCSAIAFTFAIGVHAHDDHAPPREMPERPVREPTPAREQASSSVNFGDGGGGGFDAGAGGAPRSRSITAKHGGVLVQTARGYAEVLFEEGGNVAVWWMDARGEPIAPPKRGWATAVVAGKPLGLALSAAGDRLVGSVGKVKPASIAVQADVGGRTTTVRVGRKK